MNSLFENISYYLEVYRLANIKSAKKRILVNETKAAKNKAIKSRVKTSVKKVEAAVAKVFTTKKLFPERFPVLQKL